MSNLEKYKLFIKEYYEVIFKQPWWDGRREKLVTKMENLLSKLTKEEKDLILEFSEDLYEKYQNATK